MQLAQIGVELVEALLPMRTVFLDPTRSLFQWLGLQAAGTSLSIPPTLNESGPLEHSQVFRDSGQAHIERRGEFPHSQLAVRYTRQNRTPGRIGERSESRAQAVCSHS
jgi:hypothetical protein